MTPDGKWVLYFAGRSYRLGTELANQSCAPPSWRAAAAAIHFQDDSSVNFLCEVSVELCVIAEPTEDRKHSDVTTFDPLSGTRYRACSI